MTRFFIILVMQLALVGSVCPAESKSILADNVRIKCLSSEAPANEKIIACQKAVTVSPRDARLFENLGIAEASNQNYSEAIRYLTKAMELSPQNWYLYSERGVAYYKNGDIEHASSDADTAIKHVPAHDGGYLLRARLREERGDYSGALDDYQKASEVTEDKAYALENVARVNKLRGARVVNNVRGAQTKHLTFTPNWFENHELVNAHPVVQENNLGLFKTLDPNIEVRLLNADFDGRKRELHIDINVKNSTNKPARLGEFVSNGFRYINPSVFTSNPNYYPKELLSTNFSLDKNRETFEKKSSRHTSITLSGISGYLNEELSNSRKIDAFLNFFDLDGNRSTVPLTVEAKVTNAAETQSNSFFNLYQHDRFHWTYLILAFALSSAIVIFYVRKKKANSSFRHPRHDSPVSTHYKREPAENFEALPVEKSSPPEFSDELLAALLRLGELKEKGVITEDEFNIQKRRLLTPSDK